MLFTRNDLLGASFPVEGDESPLMEIAEFHRHQFHRPIQGEVVAHRGSREEFSSSLDFWLWSLWHIERPASLQHATRLAEAAVCEPLDENGFFAAANVHIMNLKRPAPDFLRHRSGFRQGLTMYRGIVLHHLRHSILAEFEDDLVTIHHRVGL